MSKKNRKYMYDLLVANQRKGIQPDLSQDDGALVKEFGEPNFKEPKPAPVMDPPELEVPDELSQPDTRKKKK